MASRPDLAGSSFEKRPRTCPSALVGVQWMGVVLYDKSGLHLDYYPSALVIIILYYYPSALVGVQWMGFIWVFITGGCSGKGVQWMGVVLYDKLVYSIIQSLHPVSTAPPFDES